MEHNEVEQKAAAFDMQPENHYEDMCLGFVLSYRG